MPEVSLAAFVQQFDLPVRVSLSRSPGVLVHLRLWHDRTNQSPVKGKIYGNNATAKKLYGICANARPYVTIKSVKKSHSPAILSREAIIHGLTSVHRGDNATNVVTHEVGDVTFDRVSLVHALAPAKTHAQEIAFYLQGPSNLWGVYGTRRSSWTGSVKTKHYRTKINLGRACPLSVKILPHYFHASEKLGGHDISLATRTYSLQFRTKGSGKECSDAEFVSRCTELTEDALALAAFVSRAPITWYQSIRASKKAIVEDILRNPPGEEQRADIDDAIVDISRFRAFLRRGMDEIAKWRKDGLEMRVPLALYVSSYRFPTIEERYIAAFRALENLVQMLGSSSASTILSKKDFQSVRAHLKATLQSELKPTLAEQMSERLPELNRLSFQRRIDGVCRRLRVSTTEGLYPVEQRPTFIQTRNRLVHGQHLSDVAMLSRETTRVRVIFERLMLRALEWKDLSRAPRGYITDWLVKA